MAILWYMERRGAHAILPGHERSESAAAFNPDGCLLATGGEDQTIRLWDVVSGRMLKEIEQGSGAVHALAFSSDGAMLNSVCE